MKYHVTILVLDKQDEIPHQLKVESKTLLKTHDGSLVKGVSVTKKSDGLFDFVSRYFAPWVSHIYRQINYRVVNDLKIFRMELTRIQLMVHHIQIWRHSGLVYWKRINWRQKCYRKEGAFYSLKITEWIQTEKDQCLLADKHIFQCLVPHILKPEE